MKKNVLIASIAIATLFALTLLQSASVFAQTKFISHRSHSGIDRLFEPDGAGNFGIVPEYSRWMPVDTVSRPDTPATISASINIDIRTVSGESAPESVQTTSEELIQNLPQFFQPHPPAPPIKLKNEVKPEHVVEPEIMRQLKIQPETPQGEIQVKDSVVKLEEPSISSIDERDSATPVAVQTSVVTASEENSHDHAGSLAWLALGLAFSASTVVFYGINQRGKRMG